MSTTPPLDATALDLIEQLAIYEAVLITVLHDPALPRVLQRRRLQVRPANLGIPEEKGRSKNWSYCPEGPAICMCGKPADRLQNLIIAACSVAHEYGHFRSHIARGDEFKKDYNSVQAAYANKEVPRDQRVLCLDEEMRAWRLGADVIADSKPYLEPTSYKCLLTEYRSHSGTCIDGYVVGLKLRVSEGENWRKGELAKEVDACAKERQELEGRLKRLEAELKAE